LGLLKNDQVVFFGFASEKQLADLYRQAELYIFPSFMEGFGLPPLEAMSYELPVVSSDSSCLPEILGEAAMYFNPRDQQSMIKVVRQVLSNQQIQDDLKAQGLKQVQKYSWEKCAQETLAVYSGLKRR